MKRRRRRSFLERRWPPALEWLRAPFGGLLIVLGMLALLVSLPVTLPIVAYQQARRERRKKRRAARTFCVCCGQLLGEAAIAKADAEWTAHLAELHRTHPGVMFRLVRTIWAVCVVCGQAYDYHEDTDVFSPCDSAWREKFPD